MPSTGVFRGITERDILIKDLSGLASGGTYTLTIEEAKYGLIKFVGSVTGAIVVAFPTVPAMAWHVWNAVTHTDSVGQLLFRTTGSDVPVIDGAIATILLDDTGAPRNLASGSATSSSGAGGGNNVLLGAATPPSWTIVQVPNAASTLTLTDAEASAYFIEFQDVGGAGSLCTVTFPAIQGKIWVVRNARASNTVRCKALGDAGSGVDVGANYDDMIVIDTTLNMGRTGLPRHGGNHSMGGIDEITRGMVIPLCMGFTPLSTGADVCEVPIPFDPVDGTTLRTWHVKAIDFRVQTAGGAPSVTVEYSSASTAFVAAAVGTVTLGSGAFEGRVTAALGTVASGGKLRFNVITLATALNWSIAVELGYP